jgi:transcriptional regulator with XRE-family HTH domain
LCGLVRCLPASNPTSLGNALRLLRRRRGLSQAALAESLGVQRSYLSQLENGDFSEQVKRLFDTLNVLGADLVVLDRTA